jgi:cell division septum initiation protein DivIVA
MNENSDLLPNFMHEEFEMQMRGYSRRQVDEYVARRNNEIRDLEQRLTRALDESEQLRREVSSVRQQALAGRPAHEEVSERIAQILKLADDEAKAQKSKADEEISSQRSEAQQEADRVRADAREQAERMLTAAQEQAERTIAAARTEADKARTTARTEADRLTADTRKKTEQVMSDAQSQAKKVTDEANARATAIHDGAERRLNLLSTRHADTVRRLTDILDGVQGLVAAESARMSLEEEVNQSAAGSLRAAAAAENGADGRDEPGRDIDRDLAALAPPPPSAAEARPGVAGTPPLNGMPFRGGPALPAAGEAGPIPGRSLPAGPESPFGNPDASFDPFGAPLPGRLQGEDGFAPQLPPPPPMPRRLTSPPEDMQRGEPIPMPAHDPATPGSAMPFGPDDLSDSDDGGVPVPGTRILGRVRDVLSDYDPPQGNGHGNPGGVIDPDEPTEGVRLVR